MIGMRIINILSIPILLLSTISIANTKPTNTNIETKSSRIKAIENTCTNKSLREMYHKIRRTTKPPKRAFTNNTIAYEYYLRARCFRMKSIDTSISKKLTREQIKAQNRAIYILALKWYNKAALLGHITSHIRVAYMHLNGQNGERKRSTKKYLEYLQRAAKLNDGPTQHLLSRVYLSGRHKIKRDIVKGKFWMARAVKNNNSPALKSLGDFHLVGRYSYPHDINKAISYYKKSFQLNQNRDAAIMMGLIHYNGIGLSKNKLLSKKWFLRAKVNRRVFFDDNCLSVFAHRSGVTKKHLNFYNKSKAKTIGITETRCFKREKAILVAVSKK